MRIPFPVALVVVVAVCATASWSLTQALASPPPYAAHGHIDPVFRPATLTGWPTALLPGWSFTAMARHRKLRIYASPNATAAGLSLGNPTSVGQRLTLLVKRATHGWVEVYLPMRPNGSTGWVPRTQIMLSEDAWALRVQLSRHRLLVILAGRVVRTFSVGVGTAVTSTPTGLYYITDVLKQPAPSGLYGPYAFGLSAHSDVLTYFGNGGDGQIGIHGTNEPWLVGTDVSHGCIRLTNRNVTWLAGRLPLGTPVTILG